MKPLNGQDVRGIINKNLHPEVSWARSSFWQRFGGLVEVKTDKFATVIDALKKVGFKEVSYGLTNGDVKVFVTPRKSGNRTEVSITDSRFPIDLRTTESIGEGEDLDPPKPAPKEKPRKPYSEQVATEAAKALGLVAKFSHINPKDNDRKVYLLAPKGHKKGLAWYAVSLANQGIQGKGFKITIEPAGWDRDYKADMQKVAHHLGATISKETQGNPSVPKTFYFLMPKITMSSEDGALVRLRRLWLRRDPDRIEEGNPFREEASKPQKLKVAHSAQVADLIKNHGYSVQDALIEVSKSLKHTDFQTSKVIEDLKSMGLWKYKASSKFATTAKADPNPTDAQKEAGNYKKHHVSWNGLQISIENHKGSTRSGTAPDGTKWECEIPAEYGYIKRTEGADGDHVDVYLGEHEDSPHVVIVNQRDLESGDFDEHKCMIGFPDERTALQTYVKGFSDDKGSDRILSFAVVSLEAFKNWLKNGDTKSPANSMDLIHDHTEDLTDGNRVVSSLIRVKRMVQGRA